MILSKLDNVDDAKKQRYMRVYAKLKDFEEHIWHQPIQLDSLDSLNLEADAQKSGKVKKTRSSRRSKASTAAPKAPKYSGGSSSPRVSARRQRR